MAKDVDLSSQGWRDLIFEGKNKEFGAYQMRKNSEGRHNKSMIVVIIALAAVLAFLIPMQMGLITLGEEEVADAGVEQAVVDFSEIPEEEPIEEPEVIDDIVECLEGKAVNYVPDAYIDMDGEADSTVKKEAITMTAMLLISLVPFVLFVVYILLVFGIHAIFCKLGIFPPVFNKKRSAE